MQRWELINRFASVDCWTACEAPGDDTLETTSQEGPVEELLNGAKCKRRRGVLSVSGDGRGRCGGRGGRWEEESRRNDEGPGPKSDGLAAICPASESHRIRVATNMSIALFSIPIAAPSLHHRVTSPCHTPDLGPCATSVAYPPLQSERTWHRRTRNSSPPQWQCTMALSSNPSTRPIRQSVIVTSYTSDMTKRDMTQRLDLMPHPGAASTPGGPSGQTPQESRSPAQQSPPSTWYPPCAPSSRTSRRLRKLIRPFVARQLAFDTHCHIRDGC